MARLDMCPPLRGQPDPLARDRDSKRLIGHGSNRRPYTRAADTRPTLLVLKNPYAALRPAGWKRWPVEGIPYNFPWISYAVFCLKKKTVACRELIFSLA